MSNIDILGLPDVRAALRTWWDETGSFERGSTSAGVVADLLDDYGYTWSTDDGAVDGAWLRRGAQSGGLIMEGPFHEASGIFRLSVSTMDNPVIMHMVQWFGQELRARGLGMAGAVALIAPCDAHRIAYSREYRDYARTYSTQAVGFVHPQLFGMLFVLSDVQPAGQIDCWCGETYVTARVY